MLAAERLSFKAAEAEPDAQAPSTAPRPFAPGRGEPGEGWLVRERVWRSPGAARTSSRHQRNWAQVEKGRNCPRVPPPSRRPRPL